jgi:4-carboxymuconolactone decarboxylase
MWQKCDDKTKRKIMSKLIKSILFVMMLFVTITVNAQGNENQNLNPRQKAIINISSLTATGNLEKLKPALATALEADLSVNEVKEVLMHLYAYAGFPRSLQGIQTFITVLDERKAKGINDKMGRTASPIKDKRSKYERGKENLAKLTGVQQDGPPTGYATFAPEIEVFLKEHLFADLFDRDVLTYAERELITVSVNASIGGVEPMVRSHMAHSLTQGITPDQLKGLVNLVEVNVGIKEASTAKTILKEVLRSKGLNADIEVLTDNESNIKSDTINNIEQPGTNAIFPKGEKAPQENFSGTAWASRLVQMDATGTYSIGNVIFEPGARTNWHTHPAGQTLLVLEGKGWYQEKGKPARSITKGDVVEIPADTEHWHGAAKDSSLTHLAITNRKDGGVKWLQPVTDAAYNSVK